MPDCREGHSATSDPARETLPIGTWRREGSRRRATNRTGAIDASVWLRRSRHPSQFLDGRGHGEACADRQWVRRRFKRHHPPVQRLPTRSLARHVKSAAKAEANLDALRCAARPRPVAIDMAYAGRHRRRAALTVIDHVKRRRRDARREDNDAGRPNGTGPAEPAHAATHAPRAAPLDARSVNAFDRCSRADMPLCSRVGAARSVVVVGFRHVPETASVR